LAAVSLLRFECILGAVRCGWITGGR
jgi:hypothetical protein